MIPPNEIIQKKKLEYDLERGKEELNHLLFKDYLKLFIKYEVELDNRDKSVQVYSNDVKLNSQNWTQHLIRW